MKTSCFNLWESNVKDITDLKKQLEEKRGAVLSKNLIIKEALLLLKEKESFL
jgi:hypothetical protein